MLNILAVHPPYPGAPEVNYMPLGFGVVLAIAKREHRVTLLDLLNARATWADLEHALERGDYDVCLMGGFAMQVEAMREVTRLVKEKADAVAMGECELVLRSSSSRSKPGSGGVTERNSTLRLRSTASPSRRSSS